MRYAFMLVLGWALCGCTDQGPGDDGRPISLEIRPGIRLSTSSEWVQGDATWDHSGQWLYYVGTAISGEGPYVARARRGGGQRELLDVGGALPQMALAEAGIGDPGLLRPIAPLPDGSVLVAVWRDDTSTTGGVVRWSAADTAVWLPGLADARGIALSPDARYLLYRSGDGSLCAHDMPSHATRVIGPGDPYAFAPATPDLLYRTDDGQWTRYSLAAGTRQAVSVTLGERESVSDARWDAAGLRLVTVRYPASDDASTAFALLDLEAGERHDFYELSFSATASVARLMPDGDRVALWLSAITDPCTLTSGCVPHAALYLIGLADGSETWVAGVRDSMGSRLVFSPDGGSAVYTARGALHQVNFP
jgi:hypothetical protein